MILEEMTVIANIGALFVLCIGQSTFFVLTHFIIILLWGTDCTMVSSLLMGKPRPGEVKESPKGHISGREGHLAPGSVV